MSCHCDVLTFVLVPQLPSTTSSTHAVVHSFPSSNDDPPPTHVAVRLPQPQQNGTELGVNFFEYLYPYEDKMSIKKIFINGLQNY